MQFWYMQLHPGLQRDKFPAAVMKEVVLNRRLIGLGNETQWKHGNTYQIDKFRKEVEIGDVVMCADGETFLALVRVMSAAFERTLDEINSSKDGCWFGVARQVEILSDDPTSAEALYNAKFGSGASKTGSFRSTLCHLRINHFIEFWYDYATSGTVPPQLIPFENELKSLDETERRSESVQRRGQQELRKFLLKVRRACEVTGIENPQLLRVSHIKAWRDSTNKERLDPENVLLLAANYDAAFDKFLISFDPDTGVLVQSKALKDSEIEKLGIRHDAKIPFSTPRRKQYLEWHIQRLLQTVAGKEYE